MKMLEFTSKYPDKISCITKLREMKEKRGRMSATNAEVAITGKPAQEHGHGESQISVSLPVHHDAL